MELFRRLRTTAPSFPNRGAPWLVWGALFLAVWPNRFGYHPTWGASFRTANFVVHTSDSRLAQQFAEAAESHRHQLAVEWLGTPLPDWANPCIVTAHVGPHLGAGGATTFVFDRGEVFGWRMTIQGPAERIIDSVLPHEITHMILASYFRRPLPRWADEGAATSVEHPTERAKYQRMLHEFLRRGQAMPLSRLFALQQYPPDMLTLYAQGHVLADYLIQQGGRRKFVEFLETAMETGDWELALARHYGYNSVDEFQRVWLAWVRQGSPPLRATSPELIQNLDRRQLALGKRPRPAPNLILRLGPDDPLPTIHVPDTSTITTVSPPTITTVSPNNLAATSSAVLPAGPLVAVDQTFGETPDYPIVANSQNLPGVGIEDATSESPVMSLEAQLGISKQPICENEDATSSEVKPLACPSAGGCLTSLSRDNSRGLQPFAPGSIRPTPTPGLTTVHLGLPFSIQSPAQSPVR